MTKDTDALRDYDAGLLNDFGGGDVSWWQDYLRTEIERANEWWRSQVAALATPASAELGFDPTMEVDDEVFPHDASASDVAPVANWSSDIAKAPISCHVLASYFDHMVGEWICEFVQSPPSDPWTHYMVAGTPDAPLAQSVDPVAGGEALREALEDVKLACEDAAYSCASCKVDCGPVKAINEIHSTARAALKGPAA